VKRARHFMYLSREARFEDSISFNYRMHRNLLSLAVEDCRPER
jgi:hypothetical protein